MVLNFVRFLGEMVSGKGRGEAPPSEVSLTSCLLEEVDTAVSRKLSQGEELALSPSGDRVAVLKGAKVAGLLPESECARVARLLEGKAGLSCRVGMVDGGQGVVRVRICIRM